MSIIDKTEGDFIRDNSIIEEYKRIKMKETLEENIIECNIYLQKLTKETENCELLEHEKQLYNIVKSIITRKKESITLKQKEILCSFIANEAFWHIGPNKMLELIQNQPH